MKKNFYFLRHGKTDFNNSTLKIDHADVSLNNLGIKQAQSIKPLIASLFLKSVCYSPLKRAKETKEIVCSKLQIKHYEMPEFGECTEKIWNAMTSFKTHPSISSCPHVENFLKRTSTGLNQVLALESPTLIVSHGGVHLALCFLMQIQNHDWIVDNCAPIHFFLNSENRWMAKALT